MKTVNIEADDVLTLGWREWVGLPELGINRIKAKIDTGARTSTLHAFKLVPFLENGVQRIEFQLYPKQNNLELVQCCTANVTDKRWVTDSSGHRENRWVISSLITIGLYFWPIELTLTARENMRFQMLLGRNALNNRAHVNPAGSYLVGKKRKHSKTG